MLLCQDLWFSKEFALSTITQEKKGNFLLMFWLLVPFLTLSTCLPEFFKRCKWDVSGRLEAGPCWSKRINFDSFPFFLKLRILSIIAVSLSESMCVERFCSAQWLAWKLKLETNCKCFSAAEPVCSPGIITVIAGLSRQQAEDWWEIMQNTPVLWERRSWGYCWVLELVSFACILNHSAVLLPDFTPPNKLLC